MGRQAGILSHKNYYFFYCTVVRMDKLQTNIRSSSLAPVFLHAVPGAISRRQLTIFLAGEACISMFRN